MKVLEQELGPLPNLQDENIPVLLQMAGKRGIEISKPHTLTHVVDKLVSELVESKCIQPTFIYGHPKILSPLAKTMNASNITARFELFIMGMEYVNAYEELNDPVEQRKRFAEQKVIDEEYCKALEYGLPPCGGWGLGIDRLAMLLANTTKIRDVISFPIVK
jgi:lysyl-tRNA synthetase class 2